MTDSNIGQNLFTVGSAVRAANAYTDAFRASEDSALVISDGHSRWYESTSRGLIYTATTIFTGTTLVAGNMCDDINNVGPAAAAATVLTLLNPVGSGVNLEILQGWVATFSSVGENPYWWVWCGQTPGVSITAAEAVAIKRPNFIGQTTTRAKAWSQTALTGGKAHVLVRPFPYNRVGTGDPNEPDRLTVDNVDGSLVIPEGAAVTIAPGGGNPGTSWVVGAGIQYAEVLKPE